MKPELTPIQSRPSRLHVVVKALQFRYSNPSAGRFRSTRQYRGLGKFGEVEAPRICSAWSRYILPFAEIDAQDTPCILECQEKDEQT